MNNVISDVCDVCVDDNTEPICLPGYTCKVSKTANVCMPLGEYSLLKFLITHDITV